MNNCGTKKLETKRLILRKFAFEDTEQVFLNWASDGKATEYFAFGPDKSVEETKVNIEGWINEYDKENKYIWCIQEKNSNQLIGTITADMPYKELQTCEVAYIIGSKWWNKGYATEALIEVIRYLLIEEGVYLVEAKHNSDNVASGKVLLKAGMRKETELRGRRINKMTGRRGNLAVYSIIRIEIND
jgi:Acetyltransferases, including N-acetylases of ribosomal proteins